MSAPTITVKDVWRGVLPAGTDLLGGGGGLERRVEWACALRTRPPAFEAVKGGEIAFVPVKSIRLLDERLDLPQVMVSFAEKGGVAVAVVGDVSLDSIAAADRLMMPLLRLPDGVHATDAHQTCIRYILDQRALLHERAQELQLSLMDLALGGAGPDRIIERLAEVTGLPAAWQDESGQVRHLTGAGASVGEELEGGADALRRWGGTIAALGADPPVREFTSGEERPRRARQPCADAQRGRRLRLRDRRGRAARSDRPARGGASRVGMRHRVRPRARRDGDARSARG